MDTTQFVRWSAGVVVIVGVVVFAGWMFHAQQPAPAPNDQNVAANNEAPAPSQQPAQPQAAAIDYGVLGRPTSDEADAIDPGFKSRSPEDDLALFRKEEANPPQGTADHPMNWDAIEEQAAYRRVLFYAAAEKVPQLIQDQDWKWVRADEQYLISASCENAGSPGALYQLSSQQCAGVK